MNGIEATNNSKKKKSNLGTRKQPLLMYGIDLKNDILEEKSNALSSILFI